MDALETLFVSRSSMRDALLPAFADGGIFVAGAHDLTVGSPVLVRVACVGLAAALYVEGLVQWRRGPDTVPGPAGLAVRLLPSERERFAFLQRWSSSSQHADSGRTETRDPFEQTALITTGGVGRRTGRMLHGRFRDVSAHGARVAVPARLASATLVALELQVDGVMAAFPARVAWSTDDRAGLRLALERAGEAERWNWVLGQARTSFRDQLRRASSPSTATTAG